MTCIIKRFIPNDKMIYSFNMYKEFQDKASLKKYYLNKHHYLKEGLFIRRGICIYKKENILGDPLASVFQQVCSDD